MVIVIVVIITPSKCCVYDNIVVNIKTMKQLDTILSMAIDLTKALNAKDRYQRFLHAIGSTLKPLSRRLQQ